RELVRAGQPEGLVGLAECSWLDVKGEVYILDRPHGAEELLKDVAAFANAQDGGILLMGFTTRKENDQEVIDQVRPVPRAVVDLDRYRKLLDRIIQAVAAARAADQPAVPVIQPGEGDPSWERRFREVADAVRGRIRLG